MQLLRHPFFRSAGSLWSRLGRIHYGWIVLAVTFLTLLAAAGIRATPGIMMVPLEVEFGWSRATISFAVSVNLLLYGLIAPFAAALLDSFGLKRTMTLSMTLLAIGVSLTTRIQTPWQMVLLWGVVVGCGAGMTAFTLSATVANRWFTSCRGVVMGALTASTATGQLLFLPVLAALTESYGWRSAAWVVAGSALVMVPILLLFMRDRPGDLGLRPYGEVAGGQGEAERAAFPGNPFRSALSGLSLGSRSYDFWLLCASFFVCGASANGLVGTHLIPACIDHGIPELRAAGLLALMGILDLAGTTGSGWLSDRVDNRKLLCFYYALRGVSLLGLPAAIEQDSWGLSVFAVFYGLDWIATVPPTVRLTADLFGREKVGVMFGWMFASHQVGAALAAFGAGMVRTRTGDYLGAFLFAGLLCMVAALLVLRIGCERAPAAALAGEESC